MVIVKLMGGLGNQMFQYAAARRLAHRRNAPLKLDLSFLEESHGGDTKRRYELGALKIRGEIATPEEVAAVTRTGGRLRKSVVGLLRRTGMARNHPGILKERHFHLDRRILEAPDNVYLDGYWQSEKYFEDVSSLIRDELSVKSPLEGKNLEWAGRIREAPSISLHVRRGDYVSNPETTRYHGTCDRDYYGRCLAEIRKNVPDPRIFVFSDDLEGVRMSLTLPSSTLYVDVNSSDQGHEDMRLMSLCKHNIIANSSFSWWGAWLNGNPGKIVCAPRKWFAIPGIGTDDLLPESWIPL